MASLSHLFFWLSIVLLAHPSPCLMDPDTDISVLMAIKAGLDPQNLVLTSWSPNATHPCNFEGIACNELGQVVNISLQGKGLYGKIPPEIAQINTLSGLYLHFNHLHGVVPREIANLTHLLDLYLNSKKLIGQSGWFCVPAVLQLCYNKLSGNIPNQLGSLKNLTVLALQSNHLTGAIPATLGDLSLLTRLDLSFNHLFGSIPAKLANAQKLQVLDIRNNTLSGNVPLALKRLNEGFQYTNNPGLCGIGFSSLKLCTDSTLNPSKPEPFGPGSNHLPTKDIPESANVQPHALNKPRKLQTAVVVVGVIGLIVAFFATGLFTFSWYRRRKQKIGSTIDTSDSRLSTDQAKEVSRRSASPLINLEYSNGWDPLAKARNGNAAFSQEVLESFTFNLDEVESATHYFSETNLLGKSGFSAVYKGILRDGSSVAIKCISKSSCKSDEAEFRKGLKLLTSLKHENLLRLRGFCCSKDRGECFLIYNFVSNGSLLQYLDVKDNKDRVLGWSTRVSIIKGIARADDIVFSTLKGSAAMGYLAPEYTTTGRFTEKSDIYAFGVTIFQILSGKIMVTHLNHQGAELGRYEEFIDAKLQRNFVESEAAKLGKMALLCIHESPSQRPSIETLMQEINDIRD
nr:LRR receptor-like serine/threonine-protein kinase GSO1 [Ipomoea batatas]